MGKMGVQVVLEAEDRARGVLDQFGNTVVDLSEKSERGLVRMETAVARTTRSVRQFAVPLVSELVPALDTTVARVASVTSSAMLLGSGFTALGIAAAGVAGVVGGQLLQAWRKNREEAEQLQRTLASMDFGKIEGAIGRLNDKLEEESRTLRQAEAAWRDYWAMTGAGRPPDLSRPSIFGQDPMAALALSGEGPLRHPVDEVLADLARARRAREDAEIGAGFGSGFAEFQAQRQRRGGEALTLFDQIRGGAFEAPFIVDPIERAVRERSLQLRPQVDLLREFGLEREARQLTAIPERLREQLVREQGAAEYFRLSGLFDETRGPTQGDLDEVLFAGRERRRRADEEEYFRLSGLFDETRGPTEYDAFLAESQRLNRARREPSAIALGRVGALQRQEGLTRSERDALAFARIEAERSSALSDITLTPERRGLVEFEADVSRANLARVRAQTTDAAAGLARGFADVEDEWGQVGLRMQEIARGTADNMHRAFADSFFSVITGDFKKLPEVGRQFGAAMVRTILEELSRLTLAPIFGSLRGGLGLGAFGFAGAGATLLPTSATAGGLPLIGPGAAMPFLGGGGTPSVVTMLQQQGVPVLSDPGGIGTFGAVPPVPVTALLPSGQMALLQTSGAAVPISGGLISDFLGSTIMQSTYDAAGNLVTGLGGLTWGQAATGAGGALGLGLTVFNALQGPPTAQNIVFSAASGALSGALLGSVIPGVGTAIGAVAGGIIGGGAGAFGKGGGRSRSTASERSRAAGQAGAAALEQAIQQAQTLEDIATIMNTWWTPLGAEVQIIMGHGNDSWWAGDYDDPRTHTFTAEDFFETGRWTIDDIKVQVGEGGIVPIHEGLTQLLRNRIRELRGDVAGAAARLQFGFEERVGGGVTRATILPATRRAEASGQQLTVIEDTILGMPDTVKEFLLRELARLDADRSLQIIRVDPASRVPLAVGAYTLPAGT